MDKSLECESENVQTSYQQVTFEFDSDWKDGECVAYLCSDCGYFQVGE